jgi:hypothetical protein
MHKLRIQPYQLTKGLPKHTISLCPVCKTLTRARLYEHEHKVIITKQCKVHGKFDDIYLSDVKMYLRAEEFAFDGTGTTQPQINKAGKCPYDCGICESHYTPTQAVYVWLTARCNLNCPICYADTQSINGQKLREIPYNQLLNILINLSSLNPRPIIIFTGGEPTLYPRLIDIIRYATGKLKFPYVMLVTNGVKLAREPEYTQQLVTAGLRGINISFDGFNDDIYVKLRGEKLLRYKLNLIEHCKRINSGAGNLHRVRVGLNMAVMPDVNDDQIGELLKFAIRHKSLIHLVVYSPLAFAGKVECLPPIERVKNRITLGELADKLIAQTDFVQKEDFYPASTLAPISELISLIRGEPDALYRFGMYNTTHPHCSFRIYFIVTKHSQKVIPLSRILDLPNLTKAAFQILMGTRTTSKGLKVKALIKSLNLLKYIQSAELPPELSAKTFIKIIVTSNMNFFDNPYYKIVQVRGIHFQDVYNFDLEKVKRCSFCYATADGKLVPCCAYYLLPWYQSYKQSVE